jgi:hypothetical protein
MKPGYPYVGEVGRSGLGVLLAVVLALEWGPPAAAVAAGAGAAIAGAAALQDDPRRIRSVMAVSAAAGLAAFLGTALGAHGPLFTLTVVVWSAVAGLGWAVSANVGLLVTALGALLVACSATPTSAPGAAVTAALAVVGGLTQLALVAAWPRNQWQSQRRALAGAYRTVAAGARKLATDPAATFDVTPLITLRDTYGGCYGLPERIAMTVIALQSHTRDQHTMELISGAAGILEALGGVHRGTRADADRALTTVDEAVDRVPAPARAPARRLRALLHEADAELFTMPSVSVARLSWSSPVVRHAMRLSAAAGVGTAVAILTGSAQGYWLPLTVLLVLRPETAHTYTRCVIRLAATVFGIAVATSVAALWHPTGLPAALLVVLLVGAAYAVARFGYAPVTAAVAAAIVFLVGLSGSVNSDTVGERLLAVTLGGALAVASHVVLPDRSLVRLHQRAGELLKAEIDYAAMVIRAFVHPLPDADAGIAAAWERTARARSAFEAASGSARADAPRVRHWLTTYRAGLNAVTASCAVLERHVPTARPETLDRRFVVAVDDVVDALRGEAPRAGRAWTLDATHLVATEQQLRESATYLNKSHVAQRVLCAEVETITRQLMTIADAES